MNITSTRPPLAPCLLNTKKQTAGSSSSAAPADQVTFSAPEQQQGETKSLFMGVVGATLGAGVGVMAGFNSGMLAGCAGASVTALPGAFMGGVAGALVAEHYGESESSKIAGAGLWGAVAGGAIAAAGGAVIGSQLSGLGAAAVLGVVGGLTGLMAMS